MKYQKGESPNRMSCRAIRLDTFKERMEIDQEITSISTGVAYHEFLANISTQNIYLYLTRFVRRFCEFTFNRPSRQTSILDWGCGKGCVSYFLQKEEFRVTSCDLVSQNEDSAFFSEWPIIKRFNINVVPLKNELTLPFEDASFDAVTSVGVLEHVANDAASMKELHRILKPGGLFFCFFLPYKYSWTQKVSKARGNHYHDRLYTRNIVNALTEDVGFSVLDFWHRQLLPKNSIKYPAFRAFERLDQVIVNQTPLKHLATNIEFVAMRR